VPFTSIGSPGLTAEIESNFMTAFEVTEALVPSESATIGVLEIGTHSVPFNSLPLSHSIGTHSVPFNSLPLSHSIGTHSVPFNSLPLSHLTSSFFSLTVLSSWLLSEDCFFSLTVLSSWLLSEDCFFSLTVLSSWLLSEDSANPLLYG